MGRTPAAAHRPTAAAAERLAVFRNTRAEGLPVARHTPVTRSPEKPRTRAHPCTCSSPRNGLSAAPPSPAAPTRCGSIWPLPNTSGARRKASGASSTRRGSPALWKAQPSPFIRRHSRDPRFSGVPGLLRHPLRRLHHLRPGRTLAHLGSRPRPHPDLMSPAPSPAATRGGRSRLRAPRGHPRPVRAGLTRSRLVTTALRHAGTVTSMSSARTASTSRSSSKTPVASGRAVVPRLFRREPTGHTGFCKNLPSSRE